LSTSALAGDDSGGWCFFQLRLAAQELHGGTQCVSLRSLFTGPLSDIMRLVSSVRRFTLFLVWAEVVAGRTWCRACEAGPSRHRVARGRHVLLAIAPRFGSTSIRVEHEPVGAEERPSTEPAVTRCLLHHAMVHSARSYTRRNAAFSALKLPSDPAPEVANSQRSCRPRKRERPGCKVRRTWEVQPTLGHGSAAHSSVRAADGLWQAHHCSRL
jgi:hypothetical protein